ncbi:MAG: IS4/Tn5 family transposase DNA-binding protein [Steroidobacteraceae bacterium]
MSNEIVRRRRGRPVPREKRAPNSWLYRELADCDLKDEWLGKRFRSLIEQLSSSPGDSIPLVCQDWANTKAAYRFLDNDRVSEAEILAGHFHATRDRAAYSGVHTHRGRSAEPAYPRTSRQRRSLTSVAKLFSNAAGLPRRIPEPRK